MEFVGGVLHRIERRVPSNRTCVLARVVWALPELGLLLAIVSGPKLCPYLVNISPGATTLLTLLAASSNVGWFVIRSAAFLGIGGGRVYDAAIAAAVAEAGAAVLVTWNVNHFLGFSPPGLQIMRP